MVYNKEAVYKYRRTHKEETDAYYAILQKQYYADNKEQYRERYDNNKENIKEYGRNYGTEYYKNNKELFSLKYYEKT